MFVKHLSHEEDRISSDLNDDKEMLDTFDKFW